MADEPASIPVEEARGLARDALIGAGAAPAHADRVADALIVAELDGRPGHGLVQVAVYADQLAAGELVGEAMPEIVQRVPSAITVDAHNGFAHPAIDLGLDEAMPCAAATGCCMLAVAHGRQAGRLAPYVERIAEAGQIGLAFAGGSAAFSPQSGCRSMPVGHPVAFAVPRDEVPPLVIDLSTTTVAQGHAMLAAQYGEAAPQDEVKGAEARRDADEHTAGADHQGAALALVVEIVAAALTARVAPVAASVETVYAEPGAGTGPVLFLIDPARLGGEDFGPRLEALLESVCDGPAVCRLAAQDEAARETVRRQGIAVSAEGLARLQALATRSAPAE